MYRRLLIDACPVAAWIIVTVGFLVGCSSEKKVLFEDDFAYPDGNLPDHYWAEGSQRVNIADGRLYIDSTPGDDNAEDVQCTVWLNRVFSGDLHIAFDAHVVSSPNAEHNINFFLFYSDPSGRSLDLSRNARETGKYKHYHALNGYIFTYVANGIPDTARFRLRDNPGFNLLAENNAYECKASKTYHIEIRKMANRLQYLVDGAVYLDATDDQFEAVHKKGLIGFRTWRTFLWVDNLKISGL